MIAPLYPAGPFEGEEHYHPQRLKEFVAAMLRCITWLREQHGW